MDTKTNKICVYAIAKNEAKFVKKWYNSMKEADCIVVLDTGSSDDTVKLLKEVGVDVVETKVIDPWRFDVARNESLKLVPEEYNILVCTDLDEIFQPGWAQVLRDNWDDELYERAEYTYVWSHHSSGKPDVMFAYNKIHNRNWVWRAPVHEYLTRKGDETNFYYDRSKALDCFKKIILHHYPDPNKSRSSYLPLIELRAKEMADTDRVSILYLAREYYFYKRYQDAIDTVDTIINDDYFDPTLVGYMHYLKGDCYKGLSEGATDEESKQGYILQAEKALSDGIKRNPEFMECYTKLGEIYTLYEYYEEAIQIVELGLKNAVRKYSWVELGANWTIAPLSILGASTFYIAKKTGPCLDLKLKAIGYFAKAFSMDPSNELMKNNFNNAIKLLKIEDFKQK